MSFELPPEPWEGEFRPPRPPKPKKPKKSTRTSQRRADTGHRSTGRDSDIAYTTQAKRSTFKKPKSFSEGFTFGCLVILIPVFGTFYLLAFIGSMLK